MGVLTVTEAFAYAEKNGVQRVLRPGELVDDTDPVVKRFPKFFESVESNVYRTSYHKGEARLEQATAAPGESRTTKRPTVTK